MGRKYILRNKSQKKKKKKKILTNEIRYEHTNMTKCNRRSNILHLSNQLPTVDDIKEAPCRFMANDDMPTLDENDAATCEGKVTLDGTSAALNRMENGSAQGYVRITTKFIKFFWKKIKSIVTNPFIGAFDRGKLSYTQMQGVIILLHKVNEIDKEELKQTNKQTNKAKQNQATYNIYKYRLQNSSKSIC